LASTIAAYFYFGDRIRLLFFSSRVDRNKVYVEPAHSGEAEQARPSDDVEASVVDDIVWGDSDGVGELPAQSPSAGAAARTALRPPFETLARSHPI
jgi:hypothetical protein